MSSSSSTPTERIRDNAADFDFNSKITYRAYSVGRYKLNTERFSYIDLYEFVASKHKLVEENYRNHLLKPLDPVGISVLEEDSKIMMLANPQYFAEKAAETGAATDYMLVPEKLIARRFMGAIATKWSLNAWLAKSAQDPNTVLIDRPVFGRTIIREILTATNEFQALHEAVAVSDPSSDPNATEYERHNYNISYKLVDCRSKCDCSLHFSSIEHLPEPQTFLLGYSRYDPLVIEINQRQSIRRKRQKQFQFWKKAVEIIGAIQTMNAAALEGLGEEPVIEEQQK